MREIDREIAITFLLELFGNSDSANIRNQAAYSLGQIGQGNKQTYH